MYLEYTSKYWTIVNYGMLVFDRVFVRVLYYKRYYIYHNVLHCGNKFVNVYCRSFRVMGKAKYSFCIAETEPRENPRHPRCDYKNRQACLKIVEAS